MSDLTGQEIKETYKDLLHMNNGNTGVTSDLSRVFDGEGTGSALHLSDTEASVMGNLGVGTTSPSAKLQIIDSNSSEFSPNAIISGSTTDVMRIGFDSGGARSNILSGRDSTTSGATESYLGFEIRKSTGALEEAMHIDSSGRVGIGTTSPDYTLHVKSSNTSGTALFENDDSTNLGAPDIFLRRSSDTPADDDVLGHLRWQGRKIGNDGVHATIDYADIYSSIAVAGEAGSGGDGGAGKLVFRTRQAGGLHNFMVLDEAGRVGIGTANPSDKLDITGDINNLGISITNGAAGHPARVTLANNEGSGTIDANNGLLRLGNGSSTTNDLVIDSIGRVGIGTTNPVWQLTVKDGHFGIDGSGYIIQRGTANTTGEYGLIHRTGYYSGSTGNHYGKVKINSIYNSSTNAAGLKFYTSTSGANSDRYVFGLDSDGTAKCVYDLEVSGNVTKSSGNFKIDHPLPEKSETHHLVHSFIEAPQADNIYRGKVELVAGKAEVNIDAVSGMTEGTFVALNRDIQVFTSNESDWDAVRGKVEGNTVIIECQNTESTATVSWLVIGERQDEHMLKSKTTDDNGKLIVEPLKPEPEPEYEVVEPEEVITEEPVAEEALVSIGASISGESLTEVSDSRAEEL